MLHRHVMTMLDNGAIRIRGDVISGHKRMAAGYQIQIR